MVNYGFKEPVKMSKSLPYYQFEVAEYLAGDIMFCSLEAQGLFAVIKSLYWQKDCKLNTDQILKRYPNERILSELQNESIIKVNKKGDIKVSFLDEQYKSLQDRRAKLSEAGKKGRMKQLNGGGSGVAQTRLGHLEEKRREEKREDKERLLMKDYIFNVDDSKKGVRGYDINLVAYKSYKLWVKTFPDNRDLPLVELGKWKESIKPLIVEKKYTPEQIGKVATFALESEFWKIKCVKIEAFIRNFEQIKLQFKQQ